MSHDPTHDKYDDTHGAYNMHLKGMFQDSTSYAPSPEEIKTKTLKIMWLRNHGFGAHMIRLVVGDESVTLAQVMVWLLEFGMSVNEITIKFDAYEDISPEEDYDGFRDSEEKGRRSPQ